MSVTFCWDCPLESSTDWVATIGLGIVGGIALTALIFAAIWFLAGGSK